MRTNIAKPERNSYIYLVKFAKVHGLEAVDGRPDVLAVATLLDQLQLADTRHVSQSGLDLGHVRYLTRETFTAVH